jgi:DNA-binding NarL/FixJ family response regulator
MKTLRILLTDDHDIVRDGLRTLLAQEEHWAVCGEAASGREAVKRAIQLRPEIVLMDVSLPDMDGLEATRRIRRALPQTEVAVLTLHTSETMMREAFQAGAKAFVIKTDVRHDLIPAVEALSRHEPFFTSRTSAVALKEFYHNGNASAETRHANQKLTQRQAQIVQLVAEGKASKEIAARLGLSVRTVEAHRANVMLKLGLHSVGSLVRYALENGVLPVTLP